MSKNQSNQGTSPDMPLWVKIFVVILVVLILLVIVVHIMGFRFDHGSGGLLFNSLVKIIKPATPYL